MSFSKSNLNSAFLLSSKPNFTSPEPQIGLQNLSINGIMPEILPFLLSNNSQLLLKNSSLSQFSKPSSYSQPAFSNKKVKTEDGLTPKPFDMLQKLSGINPSLASSLLHESHSQIKNPILSAFHSSQGSVPVTSHQMNIGSELKRKLSEDNLANASILSGLLKQIQNHSSSGETTAAHITDTVTQIKYHNLIPMAQPGLLEVQQSEIIFNPILTNSIHENIQHKIQNNLNLLNYQRQSLQIPLLISQNLAFNNSDGNLNSLLNFQNNSNVASQLLNFSNPSQCDCSHAPKKESAKNPCSSEVTTSAKKKGKTYKKFIRKQQERSEEQTATSLDTEMTETSPRMAERKLNKLQQMRIQKEEEQTKRKEEMLKNGETELVEPELTREQVGEEAIQEFLNNVEGVYSNPLTEVNKERATRLLSKFNWNIPKVLDSIKKNKSYYKKYLDALTGN